MHHLHTLLAALLLAGTSLTQTNCVGDPGVPAFYVSCPCPVVTGPLAPRLYFRGTARIGTVQRFEMSAMPGPVAPTGFVLIGYPSPPSPLPNGLVACSTSMVPINQVAIQPLVIAPVAYSVYFHMPSATFLVYAWPYFLAIPNLPAAIGVTLHAQYFETMWGTGSVPFAASPVIGFIVQP